MDTLSPDTPERSLTQLIEDLLDEEFARENHFAHLNIDQVGKFLEATNENADEQPEGEAPAEKASFDRCVALYCLILMKLEEKPNLHEESLSDLLQADDQLTKILMPETSRPLPSPRKPVAKAPAAAPPPQYTHDEEGNTVTNFELALKDTRVAAPVQAPRGAADPLWTINENPPVPPPLKGSAAPAPADLVEDEGGTRIFSSRATEYFHLAEYFKTLKNSFPLNPTLLLKCIGQSLCTALEAECIEKLVPALPQFWPHRETAIRALLDHGNRKFELHPSLRRAIDQWVQTYPDWLPDKKFPHAVVLSSLRYMMATLQPEKFQPALIETAILVFFFGQDTSAHGFPIKNYLGSQGLEELELIELLFRMSRIHRMKSRASGATTEWSEAALEVLEHDVETLSKLVGKIQFHPSNINKKVA